MRTSAPGIKSMLAMAATLAVFSAPAPAAVLYSSLASWQGATTGDTSPAMQAVDYAGQSSTSGPFLYSTTYGTATLDNASSSSGSHLDSFFRSDDSIAWHFEDVASSGTFAIKFALPTSASVSGYTAVAFDYDTADTDGVGSVGVQFLLGASVVDSASLGLSPSATGATFAGYVTSTAFDSVRIYDSSGQISTWIGVDDLSFGSPVSASAPEPASAALLGLGLAGIGLLRRKQAAR